MTSLSSWLSLWVWFVLAYHRLYRPIPIQALRLNLAIAVLSCLAALAGAE